MDTVLLKSYKDNDLNTGSSYPKYFYSSIKWHWLNCKDACIILYFI